MTHHLVHFVNNAMIAVTTDPITAPIVPTNAVSVAPTAQVAGRTVAVGYDTSSAYRIKLNLFYTKVVR